MAKSFTWSTPLKSGFWAAGANWTDTTDGTVGTLAPGSADTAFLPGGAGVQFQIVAGPGAANSLTAYGNNAIFGTLAVGSLTLGAPTTTGVPPTLDNTDALDIEALAKIVAASSVTIYESVEVDGGALQSLGSISVSDGSKDVLTSGATGDVVVVNGGVLNAATSLIFAAGRLVEDGTGTVEVGTAGGAAKGIVTVDAGATLSLGGTVTIAPAITDNGLVSVANTVVPGVSINGSITGNGVLDVAGTLNMANANVTGLARVHLAQNAVASLFGGTIASTGAIALDAGAALTAAALTDPGQVTTGSKSKLTVGTLSGAGSVTLGNSSTLTFTGTGDANVPIALGTAGNVEVDLPAGSTIGGAVSGFDSTDLIETRPTSTNRLLITQAVYTPGVAGGPGSLALSSGTTLVSTIALSGNYAGQQFLSNFTGTTYGDSNITLPGAFINGIGPGAQTVKGGAFRSYTLVSGGGASGALTLTGNLALKGAYTATSLSNISSAAGTDDTTDILANSSLTVSGNATIASNLQLTDTGSALTVGGLLTLGTDPTYAPQVLLAEGAALRAKNLTIVGPSGQYASASNTVPTLALLGTASSAELGSLSLATPGTFAIDPGSTLTLASNGGELVAPSLIDNGVITMGNSAQGTPSGALLSSFSIQSNVSGTGSLQANGSLIVGGSINGLAVAVAGKGSLTATGAVSGLQSLTIAANGSADLYSLNDTQALEVGASGSLTTGGLDGTGLLTGLASLTLDAGASATLRGPVTNVGPISVGANGLLDFGNGGSGHGAISLGSGAKLTLVNGTLTGWSGVSLAGGNTIATFGAGAGIPAVSGFDTSDQIDLTTSVFDSAFGGPYYTGAAWTQGTDGTGTLVLSEDGQALQTYTLVGTYDPARFVTYAGNNVENTGVGTSVATLANGSQAGLTGSTVTGDTGGSFLLLTGTGQSQGETVTGNVAVTGTFTFGTLQTTPILPATTTTNALLIEAGASVHASTATLANTTEVDGTGAKLIVDGNAALTNTTGATGLLAFNGAMVQLGSTTTSSTYDFAVTNIAVDRTGSIEIGHAGGAALGTLTVDAGSTLRTDSHVEIGTPGGTVLNGTWLVDATASSLGGLGLTLVDDYVWNSNLTGTGSLQIAPNALLTVLRSVLGLSSVALTGGGLTVNGDMRGIGAVTVSGGGFISLSGVGIGNFSAGTLSLADRTATGGGAFTVSGDATGTGMGTGALSVGASDSFTAGGTVSGWTSITAGSGASLTFNGTERGSPITLGTGAQLNIGSGATVAGVVSGFGKSNTLTYGFNTTSGTSIITDAAWAATTGGLGTLTLSDDGTVVTQLTLAGNYAGQVFLTNFAGEPNETVITLADPPCYCPGTLIRTGRGEVPVEELAEGDQVVTVSGALKPVVWIGRRSYGARIVRRTPSLHPVCIKAGAFGANTPDRDLWVSQQHALFLDGVLIPARCLVNGTSVVVPAATADVHYIHVELPDHDVIWANGTAAESFIDDDSRGQFHNAHERTTPDPAAVSYCAPRLDHGWPVERARRRIAANTAAAA